MNPQPPKRLSTQKPHNYNNSSNSPVSDPHPELTEVWSRLNHKQRARLISYGENRANWHIKYDAFEAKYPHFPHLIERLKSPFSFSSWRSAIPGFLMALVMTIFARTLSPEKGSELFRLWQVLSSGALLFFGILSATWQTGHHIDADDYLSISAFLVYGTTCSALFSSWTAASHANPISSSLFLISYAVTLAMLNLLTVYYLLSILFKVVHIRANSQSC